MTSSWPGRQQPGLAEHLEAVAYAQHRAALGGEAAHRVHHRREARDRAAAQVVAVGEAAGDDQRIHLAHFLVAVPEGERLAPDVLDRGPGVAVVARPLEGHHSDSHAASAAAPSRGPPGT